MVPLIDKNNGGLSHFAMPPDKEASTSDDLERALEIFGLRPPLTRTHLDEKRRELLALWHPHRYANLTNNPRKYMQMYKKGEAMTKNIHASYAVLLAWIDSP